MKVAGNFYKFAGLFLAPIVKQEAKINLRKMKAKLESMPEATT